MTRARRALAAVAAGAALLLVAACGSSSGGGGGSIKVAVAGPMTGSDAQYGTDFWRGASLAAADLKGKVTLEKFDDVDDSTQAANVAQKIASDRSISAVMGHFTTSTVFATMPIYKQNEIPQLVISASTPAITERGDKWLFRVNPPNTWGSAQVAKGLATQVKPKRIAAVYLNTDYGQADHSGFLAAAKKNGLDIVMNESYQPTTTDFTNLVLKLKQSRADAVYLSSYYNDAALIVKQAAAAGFTSHWFSGGGLYSPAYVQVGGRAVESDTWANTLPDSPQLRDVTQTYKKKYGAEPDPFVFYAYSAVRALAKAASLKGTSRSDLRDGLAQLKDLPTPVGKLTFDGNGQFQPGQAGWVTVRSGKWVRVPNLGVS
jgi:branched-chain amino acid transport system substrate-binding protein